MRGVEFVWKEFGKCWKRLESIVKNFDFKIWGKILNNCIKCKVFENGRQLEAYETTTWHNFPFYASKILKVYININSIDIDVFIDLDSMEKKYWKLKF